ncbi:chromate transporter [Oceanospirillum multiglobuliferum]|uniref:Chromate transporter n=1 Tax=Oceanospirillum multiglobuliferum TaxID=64969 RepID=A0A1T4N8N0_9GAMM|nr:chromate efflux transporter [Oceanospirillum multiglobuliferum]OPX55876.1 chromate transporter [Oceanospirillum multiglobuliferum]SJZ75561.1 chromate transporter [Oceanospirillum multiglobuliferum]
MPSQKNSPVLIFLIFLRLGLTAFGGPVAHLAYFRQTFVEQRRWLSEQNYADLVALCQFLPGPASSQVGLALGLTQGGYSGAFAAWLGFTLPSALMLTLLALGLQIQADLFSSQVLHALKIVALAVVVQAVWGMGKSLCPEKPRITLMILSTCICLLWPIVTVQLLVLGLAAIVGIYCFKPVQTKDQVALDVPLSTQAGVFWLLLFGLLLVLLPLLALWLPLPALELFSAFYRVGSLVFGGGHVVLPLLQAEVVTTGWVNQEVFVAGYGATQAVPGPLFTFAAFLGASMGTGIAAIGMAAIGLLAIFLPAFFLVAGVLPFWQKLRLNLKLQSALTGLNAAVVGLLLAVLYDPIWTGAIQSPQDFAWALLAFAALNYWRLPPWLVVLGAGAVGLLA